MPAKRGPELSVTDILEQCQHTVGSHAKYARLLWDVEARDSDACYSELIRCITYLLTVPLNSSANAERALRFLAAFAASAPQRKDGSGGVFVQDLLADLVQLSSAANKTVRTRACGLVAGIMQRISVDLEDEALDELQEAMLERLKDKVPQVRLHAAAALERLAEPGEDSSFSEDAITKSLRKLLAVERNKDVRKAILGVMPVAKATTLEDLVERTGDVNDTVRKQAFLVLAGKVDLADLRPEQRALLVKRGLRDRAPGVAQAAHALVHAWLADAGGKDASTNLLQALPVRTHAEEAELALDALAATKKLKLEEVAREAQQESCGLRASGDGSALMSAEEAFFWRWACTRLHETGRQLSQEAAGLRGPEAEVKAAEAADSMQALEAALPDSVEALAALVAQHAAAGPEHAYSATQLLLIAATCMDLSDAVGRREAAALLEQLLDSTSWASAACNGWQQPLLRLAEQVHATQRELSAWLWEKADGCKQALMDRGQDAGPGDWLRALSVASLALRQPQSKSGQRLAQYLHELLFPALSQPEEIRVAAVGCLGLLCLASTERFELGSAPSMEQKLPVSLLRAAMSEAALPVRLQAARAICDVLLLRGPKVLDSCQTYLLAHPEEALAAGRTDTDATPILDVLLQFVTGLSEARSSKTAKASTADAISVGSVVVEGLAKLLMHQSSQICMEDSQAVQIVVQLLVSYIDPATDEAAAARQCLSVFFPAYAGFSRGHRRLLSLAAIPAARRALDLPARSAAPDLLRFTLHLLQMKAGEATEPQQDDGFPLLVERCLGEVINCPRSAPSRPYVSAVAKLSAGLQLTGTDLATVKKLKVLADSARAALGSSTASKDIAALQRQLSSLDTAPAEPLQEAAIADILQHATEAAEELPFEAARSVPRRAAQKAAIVESDDDDKSETTEEEEASTADEENGGGPPEASWAAARPRGSEKVITPKPTRPALRDNVLSPTL